MSDLIGPPRSVFLDGRLSDQDRLALDRLADAAWPAPTQQNLDGWKLRYARGVSRRANSCAPFTSTGKKPLDARIAEMEAFYRANGLPPRVQVGTCARHDELNNALAARGYEIEAPVDIMIAPAGSDADAGPAHAIEITETAPPDWWSFYSASFSRDARAIIGMARETPVFANHRDESGSTAAIGLGVLGGGWLGLFSMYTKPDLRGAGVGSAILAALRAHAVAERAHGLYLQVEVKNTAAKRLYARAGFRDAYSYYYRTLWI